MGSSGVEEVDPAKAEPPAEEAPAAPSDEPVAGAAGPTNEERDLARAVIGALGGGLTPSEVARALREGGCPAAGADEIVRSAQAERRALVAARPPPTDEELTDRYARRILYGFLWTAGGVVVTVASYGAAPSGGRYILAYGAILYGVIAMMSGAAGWAKHR